MSDSVDEIFLGAVREASDVMREQTLEDALHQYGKSNVDTAIPATIQELHRKNSIKDHKIETPPLHDFPAEALQEFYNNIGGMANIIDSNAIRPESAQIQRQLREEEAARRTNVGADGVAIYKSHSANPNYANTPPQRWNATLPTNSNFRQDCVEEHRHTREDTVVLAIDHTLAEVLAAGDFIPEALLNSDMFRYLSVPGDSVEPLQSLNAHDVAIELDNGPLQQLGTVRLGAALQSIRKQTQLSVHQILLRKWGGIDVCFALDETAAFCAVASFVVPALAGATDDTIGQRCDKICAEIDHERQLLTEEAKKRKPDFATANRRDMDQIVSELRRLQKLRLLFHVDYRVPSDARGPLCRESAMAAVFDSEYSKTLLDTDVEFRCLYFSCCQCHHDEDDLKRLLGVETLVTECDSGDDRDVEQAVETERALIDRARKRMRTTSKRQAEMGTELFRASGAHSSVPNAFEQQQQQQQSKKPRV